MSESKEMVLTADVLNGLDAEGLTILGGVGTRVSISEGGWFIGKFLGVVRLEADWVDQAGNSHDSLDLLRFAVVKSEGVADRDHETPIEPGEIITLPSSGILRWAFETEEKVLPGRFVKLKYKGKKKGTNSQGITALMNDYSVLDITDALRARGLE